MFLFEVRFARTSCFVWDSYSILGECLLREYLTLIIFKNDNEPDATFRAFDSQLNRSHLRLPTKTLNSFEAKPKNETDTDLA